MQINTLSKLLKKQKPSTGYTLTELLIGASISVVVIGAAGMGLMNLLQGNKTLTTEANRRTEVNRALEFISDETRKAETIETDPSTVFDTAKDDASLNFDPIEGNADPKDNAQPILALNIPGVSQPVLYYISPAESTAWKGPKVIYRFGPNFDNSGNYTDPSNPASWTTKPLIDRISDADSNPNCGGLTASPSANAQGFYACIDNNGKTANIFAIAQLENDEDYRASTEVYARAEENALAGSNPNLVFAAIGSGGGGADGGSAGGPPSGMGCNPVGDSCLMEIQINFADNSNEYTFPSGSTLTDLPIDPSQPFEVVVTPTPPGTNTDFPETLQNNTNPIGVIVDLSKLSDPNDPNPLTPLTGTTADQVIFLKDGDDVGEIAAWNPETQPDKYKNLKEMLLANTDSDGNPDPLIQNDKLTLKPNQYILAFEVGQTNTNHPGFDLQDQIVIITVP